MITRRFFSSDGTPLCAEVYEPAAQHGPSAGTLCIIHGYCEHRHRYRDMAAHLAAEGYRVVVPDLRGHGEAGGQRAHILRFEEYLEDLSATLSACARGEPVALIGHSMGGLVAFLYALGRPQGVELRALALSSPFFGFKVVVPAWKALLGEAASRIYPGLAIPSELDPADLSHDPAVVRAYRQDPQVSKVATARWFTEAKRAQAQALARARSLKLPLLLLHGGDDRIADPAASRALFDRVTGEKSLTLYPGLYHEIFNETKAERERVLHDLTTWLKSRMPRAEAP